MSIFLQESQIDGLTQSGEEGGKLGIGIGVLSLVFSTPYLQELGQLTLEIIVNHMISRS